MAFVPILLVIAIVGVAYYAVAQPGGGSVNQNTTGTTAYNSDGSLTGAPITQDSSSWPGSNKTWELCCAIATAEGYQDGPGAIPYDYNNPGDITDDASQYGSTAAGITTFPSAEVGWQALYDKVSNLVAGESSVYPADWSWEQVGAVWANGDANWARNAAAYLGIDPSTTLASYANG